MLSLEQDPIWQQLLSAQENNRLHHALLFSGVSQGKEQWALDFAKYLLCKQPHITACHACQSCHFFVENYHPDFRVLGQDPREPVKVDHIREIVQFISQSPHTSAVKIIVICHAHLLNTASQNALLKILEEPPADVHFILTSAKPHLLLPTIKSRCLNYIFKNINQAQSLQDLKKLISDHMAFSVLANSPESDLTALLYLANGNTDDTLTWFQSPIWGYREAIVRIFILGDELQSSGLHTHLVRHAEQALYFIYLALSELIRSQMSRKPVKKHMGVGSILANAPYDVQACFEYLEVIEQAIQSVAQVPGINKLLLFQSLLTKKSEFMSA